ncbi:LuxR C-terminal-related transcriptional regulator [Kitasatospora indigofera]|uniref:LuxR C-terminal-related transcriptional regulator n=1 Tax=Kitasatospora indigofera TaxID=67307 RepID=UPI0036AD8E5D
MTTPPTAERPAERPAENAVEQPPPAKGRRARRAGGRTRSQPDPSRLLGLLTPREAQVLARLAAGDDAAQLAAALGIAPATARTHLHRTMRKIGARSPQEAAATAAALLGAPVSAPNPAQAPAPARDLARGPAGGGDAPSAPAGNTTGEPVSGDTTTAPRRAGTTASRPGAGAPEDVPVKGRPAGRGPRGRGPKEQGPREQGRKEQGPAREAPGRGGPATDRAERDGAAGGAGAKAEAPGTGRPAAGAPATVDPKPGGSKPADSKPADSKPGASKAGTRETGPRPADARTADARMTGRPAAGRAGAPAEPVRPNAARPEPAGLNSAGAAGPARAAGTADAGGDAGRTSAARPAVRPAEAGAVAKVAEAGEAGEAGAVTKAGAAAKVGEPAAVAVDPDFEELYESAYARLVQQVFLLTGARRHTLHCVRLAFGAALQDWPEVSRLPAPEAWVRARACEAALSPWRRAGRRRAAAGRLPWRRPAVRPADEGQAVLPDHDRLSDQDRALLKALRRLSRPQRLALVLHDGIGLPAAAVAVEVESSTAAAEGRVLSARVALAAALPGLVGADPADPGFGDRLSVLLHRAGVRGCPEPHRPPVPALSARHRLRTAGLTGGAALVTVVMATAVAATLFGAGPGELFKPSPPVPHPVCTNAQNGSAGPAAPGGVPPGLRTAWCSSAPGRAAVLGPPPLPALSLWGPVGPGARGSTDAAGPPGPGGAAAARCTVLTPRPCAARPQSVPPLAAPLRAAATR